MRQRTTLSRPRRSARRLLVENLEDRCLPSRYSLLAVPALYPGYWGGNAFAINDAGDVTGVESFVGSSGYFDRAVLYNSDGAQDLGTLPGDSDSYGRGINNLGWVVGGSGGAQAGHAFLYDGTQMYDLGSLGGTVSSAASLNDSGQIVGSSRLYPDRFDSHAFLDENGQMEDLGTLGGRDSGASAINASGQVAGTSEISSGEEHAFLWDAQDGMIDLGTLGGDQSIAYGINDAGWVVGRSQIADNPRATHAFLDDDTGMHDLGDLGGGYGVAFAINNAGVVVGESSPPGGGVHAFVYQDGVMTDLNDLIPKDLGWDLISARGINDAGQIVGYGTAPDHVYYGFVLTPDDALAPPASKATGPLIAASLLHLPTPPTDAGASLIAGAAPDIREQMTLPPVRAQETQAKPAAESDRPSHDTTDARFAAQHAAPPIEPWDTRDFIGIGDSQ